MFNTQKTAHRAKGKWDAIITSFALFASIVGLGALSIASFYQTLYAFDNLKDPTMVILGFPFGIYIPVFAALATQYGQNLALYAMKQFGTEERVFKIWDFTFKNKHGYLLAFAIAALIDAGTNCQWYYGTNRASQDPLYWQAVMYLFMVALVFVEEVLGLALQAFVRSLAELRRISQIERAEKQKEEKQGGSYQEPRQQRQSGIGATMGNFGNGFQNKGNGGNNGNVNKNKPFQKNHQGQGNDERVPEDEFRAFFRQQQVIDEIRLKNNGDFDS